MTAAGKIYAGSRILAADIRGVAPLSAYKGADQPLASNIVLQDDDDLLIAGLEANAVYAFKLDLGYNGGTLGSSDIKLGWMVPSGATMAYVLYGNTTPGGVATNGFWETETSNPALGTNGTGTPIGAILEGTIAMSSTPGTLQLQWAQQTSSATATTVLKGSVLLAWQVQ